MCVLIGFIVVTIIHEVKNFRYYANRGMSQDGGTAGGVYLWKSQQDAERLDTDEWKKFIRDKYGAEPSVTYFESPVVGDNVAGEIVIDA
jgi:hypothetical protein